MTGGRYAPRGRYAPLWDRLWAKVVVEGDCWRFTGGLKNGYGQIRDDAGVLRRAHRAAYELLVGAVPAGMDLDHLCRNRACVNPDHLEVVTRLVNLLRGDGWVGRNARKAACLRGHPLSGPNLYITREGWRQCRTCKRARARKAYQTKTK